MTYYREFAVTPKQTDIMEDKIITLTRDKITALYQESRNLLLEQQNYHDPVETLNVNLYFTFLESALKQPHNRLAALADFIGDHEGQLSSLMYPFSALYEAPNCLSMKISYKLKS